MSYQYTSYKKEAEERVLRALKLGIDKTTSEGTKTAKDLVHVDKALLQGSIRPEPAKVVAGKVVGQYGTHDVEYAEPQEFLPPSKGGKAYMRPSAEEAKKELPVNIKSAYNGLP